MFLIFYKITSYNFLLSMVYSIKERKIIHMENYSWFFYGRFPQKKIKPKLKFSLAYIIYTHTLTVLIKNQPEEEEKVRRKKNNYNQELFDCIGIMMIRSFVCLFHFIFNLVLFSFFSYTLKNNIQDDIFTVNFRFLFVILLIELLLIVKLFV